jgi:hypothetical protein
MSGDTGWIGARSMKTVLELLAATIAEMPANTYGHQRLLIVQDTLLRAALRPVEVQREPAEAA